MCEAIIMTNVPDQHSVAELHPSSHHLWIDCNAELMYVRVDVPGKIKEVSEAKGLGKPSNNRPSPVK